MGKKRSTYPIEILETLDSQTVGHDILRYISLPNLLGEESETLLYYMGKNLARTFDLQSIDDIQYIFEKLDWGYLELEKERKHSLTFTLMSDQLARRLQSPLSCDFRLESGFLAEAVFKVFGQKCECEEKINRNIHQVVFRIIFIS